jgi:hypothetical protein
LAPQEARQGEMVLLEENAEYLLEFQSASARTIAQLSLMGAELLTDRLWTIRFRNFVGSIELAGVSLEVLSQKIDASGVTSLLEQVSRLASQLVFGWRSPVRFTGSRSKIAKAPVLYHQLQLLRTNMLEEQQETDFKIGWIGLNVIPLGSYIRIAPSSPLTEFGIWTIGRSVRFFLTWTGLPSFRRRAQRDASHSPRRSPLVNLHKLISRQK